MANEFKDIGRDIRDAVLDAVESGDYSQLNSRITSSVGAAIDEVNDRLSGRKGGNSSRPGWNGTVKSDPCPGYSEERSRQKADTQERTRTAQARYQEGIQLYTKKPKGGVSGLLFTIFGAVFLGVFGISLLSAGIAFIVNSYLGVGFWITCGILGVLTIGSGVMLGVGQKLRGRIRLFKKYVASLRGKKYCDIRDLATKLGKKEQQVVRELREMIKQGMFPQGHIDDEEKTLLLTDDLYDQYRDLKRQREEQAAAAEARKEETPEEKLYRETVEQGEYYLEAIRRANDAIPGEVVSEKLYRLEEIVRKIFDQVRENPQQIPELRRFLDYYMPTTLKLVETYEELDRHPVAGQNIQKSKDEIEKTLDTINQAFENLFDSLFEHTAVDISSDIAVLKNMLKQEGLTDKDFT